MKIQYKENEKINITDLMELYKDAGWVHYIKDPERLKRAYENSLYIASAFDGKKLVGALRAVGDGETILFIQDILLLESYQRKGIGSRLMKLALDKEGLAH